MQTTALSLITDAYLVVGLLGEGEVLTAARAQFALRQLNDMLDSWATESLYVKYIAEIVATIAPGQTFTVGPTGDIVTTLVPIQLEKGSFFRVNGTDFEFTPITLEQYMGYPVKDAAASWPNYVHYSADVTSGTGYMLPALSASAELHALVQQPLTSFPDVTTVVDLPLGYKEPILLSLAEKLCFGKMAIPPDVMKGARAARGRIKDANGEVPVMRLPYATTQYYGYGWRV